ncbi:MAG: nucleoside-diphosphate sugar epimerase [Acidobacteria bacterium RIFCSPLOWO2_12_FULL_67_14]|nr:MAG: nucleoside-diphosphate sugar epimerase [Acidobacteria bacterium RIFCSPLOWO2_02_FULL_67_21]OFW40075.1 MAG: nucleoside-diphosphate sugar epimerase [Acidobacteria bacterium RIFCSPLOWO2_12_FULL_67_14]
MRYLVTGAAGFVGSHLTDALLARGHSVIGYDNLSTGQERFLDAARRSDRLRFVRGDILDSSTLRGAMKGVDAVFHMAANADVRGGFAAPRVDLEQNTIGTFEVLEAMRDAGVMRMVFASSSVALGEPDVVPTPEDCAIPRQTSLYGAAKMAGEGLIAAYAEGYGFEGYAFRFVSLLGPRYPHGHVFDFVKQLLADPTVLRILGDGTQRKSYLHVEDCVRAMLHIAEDRRTPGTPGTFEVFHLGVPACCLVRESAAWICDEMGVSPRLEFGTGNRGWIGDSPVVFLDVRKAMSTGWAPQHSIEESVRQTVRWLLGNRWIFDRR